MAAEDRIRGIPWVENKIKAGSERLEKAPLIGPMMGGIGAYSLEQGKIAKEESDKYKHLPTEMLKARLDEKSFTRRSKLGQAGVYNALMGRGELGDQERGNIKSMIDQGVPQSDILMRRPDWAPDLELDIGEQMAKMEFDDLRKNIQKEALENPKVVASIIKDEVRFEEMKKAKGSLKQQFKYTFEHDPYFEEENIKKDTKNEFHDNEAIILKRADEFSTDPKWGEPKPITTEEESEKRIQSQPPAGVN